MTRNFNRSAVYSFSELSEQLQEQILSDFSFENSDADSDLYVISKFNGEKTALPLGMFMRTGNNFTHGIYCDSYFSGYYVTFNKSNDEVVIAYKYF